MAFKPSKSDELGVHYGDDESISQDFQNRSSLTAVLEGLPVHLDS